MVPSCADTAATAAAAAAAASVFAGVPC